MSMIRWTVLVVGVSYVLVFHTQWALRLVLVVLSIELLLDVYDCRKGLPK